ncbi:hypothetical protein D8B46_02195, partial [Candidatus Gracilibacteria bacterium]
SFDMPSSFRGRGITLLLPKLKSNSIPVDWDHQNLLKDEAYFKLEQIKKLLFYPGCRKKFILEYFGDETDLEKVGENCGTCDFCIERKNIGEQEKQDLVKISVFSLVLETVKNFDERFGVSMITKFLYGSQDKKILEYSMDKKDGFGALSDFSSEMIQIIIEALIFKEFLYKTEGMYPVLGITETGRIAIVRNYLLSDENNDLQYFIRKKIGTKKIFKKEEKQKTEKIDTYLETLKIFEKTKNLKEIAKKRELAEITIENHILKLYELSKISLTDLLNYSSISNLKKIKNIIIGELDGDISALKPIKESLEKAGNREINYFEIKICISMLEKKDL